MKKDTITVFKVVIDGTYSGIHKVELHPSRVNDFIAPSTGFYKTFGEAKAKLVDEIKYITDDWKYALNRCKKMTIKDL